MSNIHWYDLERLQFPQRLWWEQYELISTQHPLSGIWHTSLHFRRGLPAAGTVLCSNPTEWNFAWSQPDAVRPDARPHGAWISFLQDDTGRPDGTYMRLVSSGWWEGHMPADLPLQALTMMTSSGIVLGILPKRHEVEPEGAPSMLNAGWGDERDGGGKPKILKDKDKDAEARSSQSRKKQKTPAEDNSFSEGAGAGPLHMQALLPNLPSLDPTYVATFDPTRHLPLGHKRDSSLPSLDLQRAMGSQPSATSADEDEGEDEEEGGDEQKY
jgi:hypothetical protein